MSIEIVRSVVVKFLTDSEPGVLVIKGAWGTGKTHTWDDLLKANKDQTKIPNYAYVSLFGLRSVAELRLALVAKSIPTNFVGQKIDWDLVNREWASLAKGHWKRFTMLGTRLQKAIPYLKDVSVSLDSIAGYLLSETIVCLDDWERTKIEPEELLGLISELKVEKRCKVVLIFNDDKLDKAHKEKYREYREKLVDIELVFAPTPIESVDIVIQPGDNYADLLRDAVLRLNIRNVRVIRKMQALIELFRGHIHLAHPEIQKQVVYAAVLFTWIHYGETSPGRPPIDFVRGWNRLGAALRNRHADAAPERQEWASVLGAYNYDSTDELDLAVDQVIERGYIEGTTLTKQIEAHERMLAAAEKESAFTRAWAMFHGSFEDNEQQVVDAMAQGLRESVKYVSPMNLNSTIEVLRQLKQDDLADELIDFYVDQRRDDQALFNLKMNPFGSHVTDEKLRNRFDQEGVATAKLPSLRDAVMAAASKHGWSEEEGQVMKAATSEEFYDLIVATDGISFLQSCEWMSTIQGWEAFRDKLRQALTRVANSSQLNAARVARFGIVPTSASPEASE